MGTTGSHETHHPVISESAERASRKPLLSRQTGCGPFRKVQPVVYLGGFPARVACGLRALTLPRHFLISSASAVPSVVGQGFLGALMEEWGAGVFSLTVKRLSQPSSAPWYLPHTKKAIGKFDGNSSPETSFPRGPGQGATKAWPLLTVGSPLWAAHLMPTGRLARRTGALTLVGPCWARGRKRRFCELG